LGVDGWEEEVGENKGTTRERVSETRLSRPAREEDKKFVEKEEKQKRSMYIVLYSLTTPTVKTNSQRHYDT
jgi:hypothetical protein